MKKKFIVAIATLYITTACYAQTQSPFNGRDFSNWHTDVPKMDTDKLAKSPFIIRNDMIVLLANPQGHLITNEVYQNYRLQVEYRFPGLPGNSGIIVHASTPRAVNKMYPKSIEVQLQHNNAGDLWCVGETIAAPDMENRRGPEEKQSGFYSSFIKTLKKWSGIKDDKQNRIVKLTDNAEKPPGEWNTMVIECFGSSIKVWLNGALVNDGFNCTASKGQIALQAEGDEVEFRKVDLMPITKLSGK